jgi:nitrile hydratase subunit beta
VAGAWQTRGVDGIHDMGGKQGFGAVPYERDQPPWHEPWERRAMAVSMVAVGAAGANVDEFRHAVERIPPVEYLGAGYYGRWIRASRRLFDERAARAGQDTAAQPQRGTRRDPQRPPRFTTGDRVRVRDLHRSGHTRMPGYCRGRLGTVVLVHPGFVFPDSNSERRGEQPQHVYAVSFDARDLWGPDADSAVKVHVDLFDDYLEPP